MRLAPEIVSAIQRLTLEQRRLLGVRAGWHVGDIAWGARQHEGREDEWRIRLWVEGGAPVAWSLLRQDDGGHHLDHDVHPDHLHLLDDILREPQARVAYGFEDDAERRAALAAHGFTEPRGKPTSMPATWRPLRSRLPYLRASATEPSALGTSRSGWRSIATCGRRRG